MAMGRKKARQEALWIATEELARTGGHVFYERVNEILEEQQFDTFSEEQCLSFYKSEVMGRPSIAPGVYFRMLMVGYFEGLDSERGIAWRCADSLSLRSFLGYGLTQKTPDHSTLGNHPKPANGYHLKTGQRIATVGTLNPTRPYRLSRHEQCLDRRKETTSSRTRKARLAITTD